MQNLAVLALLTKEYLSTLMENNYHFNDILHSLQHLRLVNVKSKGRSTRYVLQEILSAQSKDGTKTLQF